MENTVFNKKDAKKPCGKYTLLFVFAALIYLVTTIYLSVRLANVLGIENGGERAAALLVYLLIELSVLGTVFNVISTAFAVIGLVLTATRRNAGQKVLQLVLFSVMTALPILTEGVLFIVCA